MRTPWALASAALAATAFTVADGKFQYAEEESGVTYAAVNQRSAHIHPAAAPRARAYVNQANQVKARAEDDEDGEDDVCEPEEEEDAPELEVTTAATPKPTSAPEEDEDDTCEADEEEDEEDAPSSRTTRKASSSTWQPEPTRTTRAPRTTARPSRSTKVASSTEKAEPTKAAEKPEKEDSVCAGGQYSKTYDYIVVGGGAGGITVSDRLSESGASVLLLEKGPPSTARWGGTMKPEWLLSEPLTRFDVPGLCNQIWIDAENVACTDMDQMAGCVLGGGVAVNAGLWWKPHPEDWNVHWPEGWKSTDVEEATERVFKRIPGTSTPSVDGKRYQQEGFDALSAGLAEAGWQMLDKPNDVPTEKNHTFAHTEFMFAGGERGGPLATYLVSASERDNFQLLTDTTVKRLVRDGSTITGVELDCGEGSEASFINVTPETGRVILSAGTFGSAKLLMRSGIGPVDQLQVVQDSEEGETMIAEDDWIELPVGYNIQDHTNTDVVVEHPAVVQYNYSEAWNDPVYKDARMYIEDRAGILAHSAPNIGPMMWDSVTPSDGINRQLQWTSRMEGSLGFFNATTITMSMYLGRGAQSRGRVVITPIMTTAVETAPYLKNEGDVEAVKIALNNLRDALKDVPDLKWLSPSDEQSTDDYVDEYPVTSGFRRANHWIGSVKIGTDDGRDGGDSSVDTNTKVYGTDNLFVVDASIFPGMMTGNPSAMIVIAAEHAADKILALE